VKTWAAFRAAVQNGLTHAGLDIIEVLTRRDRNVTLHRELWQVVDAALAELT
jgi:2-succinyl-5-enolpyruvyl-6-hydroxy-3-cyclohexene-1-carboxylate synthase